MVKLLTIHNNDVELNISILSNLYFLCIDFKIMIDRNNIQKVEIFRFNYKRLPDCVR